MWSNSTLPSLKTSVCPGIIQYYSLCMMSGSLSQGRLIGSQEGGTPVVVVGDVDDAALKYVKGTAYPVQQFRQ